ncbi:PfkB family carbohydrate kinase [Streptomyces canus]|uniref:PfkB family carbohydrate kinase n=1 Tax=Streptomyces canus TaxID=58343 RepID=UPI003820353D
MDVIAGPDGPRRSHPGGSPANVALGLGRLGHLVRLATRVGHDDFGQLLQKHLQDSGVELPGARCSTPSTFTGRCQPPPRQHYWVMARPATCTPARSPSR